MFEKIAFEKKITYIRFMISVEEAKKRIFSAVKTRERTNFPLDVSNGYVCASELISPYDHPFFNNSAVDGYAVHLSEKSNFDETFSLVGEISAGTVYTGDLKANEALRIFTGAALPKSCNTVVMQEYVEDNGTQLRFQKEKVKIGNHIRKQGEEIKQGEIAFRSGDRLNPNSIAFLASLGLESIDVFKKARVRSIITGDELLPREAFLKEGHIYESNGLMLSTLLDQMKIKNSYQHCRDDARLISQAIDEALKENDIVLLSGGVSVGDYDFTRQCVEENGFKVSVHGVKQKPGKPLLFARRGDQYIFGLPGNPRAASVCFYQYVYPFLKRLSGEKEGELPCFYLPSQDNYSRKDDGKSFFINVRIEDGSIRILKKQESHILASFVLANALVELSPDQTQIKKGDLLKTYLLPYV